MYLSEGGVGVLPNNLEANVIIIISFVFRGVVLLIKFYGLLRRAIRADQSIS